jgi:hypothetical protein
MDVNMTNDELIEILEHTAQDNMADEPILKALRLVVELHKPFKVNDILLCECEPIIYPCPTILVIEKELQ